MKKEARATTTLTTTLEDDDDSTAAPVKFSELAGAALSAGALVSTGAAAADVVDAPVEAAGEEPALLRSLRSMGSIKGVVWMEPMSTEPSSLRSSGLAARTLRVYMTFLMNSG